MTCNIHSQKEAVGTCVHCGKFICEDCNTELKGKNYCKKCVAEIFDEKDKKVEVTNVETKTQSNSFPMVFMNSSGGGGGGSSSSSSSSSSSGSGNGRNGAPPYPVHNVMIHVILVFLTMGIGNVVYYLYIKNKQAQWNARYRQ